MVVTTGPLIAAVVRDALFQQGAVAADGELVDVTSEPIGDGALADTHLLRLTWTPEGAGPERLVAKVPSSDPAAAATAASLGAYEREVRFYQDLAPRTGVRTPRCFGVVTQDGAATGVLLEDLSEQYRPGEQLRDLDPAVLRRIRRQLVLLQAPFWEDEPTSRLPWLHRRLGVPIPSIHERMRRSWSSVRDTIGAALAHEERDCIDRFVACAGSWAERLGGPCSLVHHDFRVDNVMFGPDEVVLDWQTIGWGPVMFDVAYLVGTSLPQAVRRAVERDEVERHVDELAAHGIAWNAEDAWQRYRQASFAVLLMLVPATASVKTNDRMHAMYRRLLGLGARMALDLDAFEFSGTP